MVIANFVIALIGLIAAVASLAWQAATFLLSGIRVKCKMLHGGINPAGRFVMNPIRSREATLGRSAISQGFTREALFLTVHNTGRLAFAVTGWHLVFEGGVKTGVMGSPLGPRLPHRLDVGEEATWALEMQQARDVAELLHADRDVSSVTAWMEAQVGNGKIYKSKQVVDL